MRLGVFFCRKSPKPAGSQSVKKIYFLNNTVHVVIISVVSCDTLDHIADEIGCNKARATHQLDESTDVSNCMYLLVYWQYIHVVKLKD